eukprot:TRINITY_DN13909_c0_g1_i1.p1 TRINITY_DN13909_c0_g1~~TRINITY_DN13909_c0_g1_i1.p1  ORF type:complete len:437 (+),score=61.30 TRINITY_DN13909_c0_g1_i1:89-1399(+)
MADAAMYTPEDDDAAPTLIVRDEPDVDPSILEAVAPGAMPTGKPFEDIPPPPAKPREVGVWVHPQERGLREWYHLTCRTCSSPVTFPWLGFGSVSCPVCQTANNTQGATVAPLPTARIQAQAKIDETNLQKLVEAEKRSHIAAKKFADKFKWMKRRGDALERLFFGKPFRYGNFKIYLNGKVILSPTSSYYIIPPLIILGPLFAVNYLPNINPNWLMFVNVLVAIAMIAIALAHFVEPGILVKGSPQLAKQDIYEEVKGHIVPKKWCRTCHCYRTERASHCSECDVCVDRFDHHCHITGTCVGARNYKQFFVFVFAILIADVTAAVLITHRIIFADNSKEDLHRRGITMVVGIIGLIWAVLTSKMMMSMGCTMAYLLSNALTTREFVKGVWSANKNPYDTGGKLKNASAFFVAPPSHIWGKTQTELEELGYEKEPC